MKTKLLFSCILLLGGMQLSFAQLYVKDLKANSLSEPIGISAQQPVKLSWIIESGQNDICQNGFEITLRSGGKKIWSSRQASPTPNCVCNAELKPDCEYSWTLKITDNKGRQATNSSKFRTGIHQWQASWLVCKAGELEKEEAPTPVYFLKELKLDKKVAQATLYISSLGIFDASIGGRDVTDSYLNPGWTSYTKHLQYRAYDVKNLLQKGSNELKVLVAPGWWASDLVGGNGQTRVFYGKDLMLLAQLNILYSDGTRQTLCSDGSWKMSRSGPVCFATIYDGETIDKGKRFNWEPAVVASEKPSTQIISSVSTPVRAIKTIKPVRIYTSPKGEKIIDFGQNISGFERVRVHSDSKLVIRHAEDVDKDGNLNLGNLRTAKATSTFIGSGEFEPRHTFYGFRYISVEGLQGDPDLDDFEAVAISSDIPTKASFSCSDRRINQLFSNTWWSWRDNFVDIPTDCPQRSERLGWTGDAEVFYRTATYLGDVNTFTRKWLQSLSDDQLPNGGVTQVVPNTFFGKAILRHPAGWADAATIIPWQHYQAYGDIEVLKAQYPSIKAWIEFMNANCENNLYTKHSQPYGDWLSWRPENDRGGNAAVTSKGLTSQSFYIASLDIAASVAGILGYDSDRSCYEELARKARKAYMNEFVTPAGLISSDTQTAYVLALYFNILPEHQRPEALRRLLENIRRYNNHITTGFLGTPHICEVLSEAGCDDVAYTLLMQPSCPGWMYQINMGATTIWEHWYAMRNNRTLQNDGNVSLNHYSYGAICDWLYRYAAGIRETKPGFESFKVDPRPGGDLTELSAGTQCPYGTISVKWTARDNKLTSLEVTVPVGTRAEIHCPDGEIRNVGSGKWKF